MKQRLYKMTDTGKIQWWEVETDGPILTKRWAKSLDGKVTERPTDYTGKGKQGRTDAEQAEMVANAEIKKQIDGGGYVFDIEHTAWPITNGLGFALPMLATAKKSVSKPGIDYTDAQQTPKLDGHRMMLGIHACLGKVADPRYPADGEPTLYSRGGQKIDLPHILDEVYPVALAYGLLPDGELYHHGTLLQDVKTLLKNKDQRLQWYVYDTISDLPHYERRKLLGRLAVLDSVEVVESQGVLHEEHSEQIHNRFMSEGYEGSIIRWSDEGYKDDGRPDYLTKLKDFIGEEEEFEIIELVLDKPRVLPSGEELYCPSYICRNNDGSDTTFKVTVEGNMREKHGAYQRYLEDKSNFEGKFLTMTYQQRSAANIPTIMTAIRVREDI